MRSIFCLRRVSIPASILMLLALPRWADGQQRTISDGLVGAGEPSVSVRGELRMDDGGPAGNDLVIELARIDGDRLPLRADLTAAGDFEFDRVPAGQYELRVTDLYGNMIHHAFVSIARQGELLDIRIPRPQVQRPVSGTVSVSELQRKVDSKAVKEFRKAEKASGKGKLQEAIEHLNNALAIDPGYIEAYNNLGANYMHLNQYEKALNEFQKAAELEPNSAVVNANLGVALYTLGRYEEAEKAERAALKSDASSKRASYVLGMSLKALNRDDDGALDALERAAPQFPKARLAAAEILAHQGQKERAIGELKRYLSSGKVEDARTVETWISDLQEGEWADE